MRIISGSLKGRKIIGFDIDGTRPTMDRVKESLFSIIQDKISNSTCLDLFAGSGNLGLEAISRGAKKVVFIDKNKKAIKVINNNINNFNVRDKAIVFNLDFKKELENCHDKFDIIFLDPPYKTNYIEESLLLIDRYDLLCDNGIIICESDLLDKIIYSNSYEPIKNRKYGDKYIVILKKI